MQLLIVGVLDFQRFRQAGMGASPRLFAEWNLANSAFVHELMVVLNVAKAGMQIIKARVPKTRFLMNDSNS